MDKKIKALIILVTIVLAAGVVWSIAGIVLEKTRVDRFADIRKKYKGVVHSIDYEKLDDYVDKVLVSTDFSDDESKSDIGFVDYNDTIYIDIGFKNEFNDLDVKNRLYHLHGLEDAINEELLSVRTKVGYERFFEKEGEGNDSFSVKSIHYTVIEKIIITYCCGPKRYILEPMTLVINDQLTKENENYKYFYHRNKITEFEKYEEPTNEDTVKTTESSSSNNSSSSNDSSYSSKKKKSSSSYSTKKSHDPDDYDIDTYYEDYKDDFEDEDDAWDDFEDNEGWEDY